MNLAVHDATGAAGQSESLRLQSKKKKKKDQSGDNLNAIISTLAGSTEPADIAWIAAELGSELAQMSDSGDTSSRGRQRLLSELATVMLERLAMLYHGDVASTPPLDDLAKAASTLLASLWELLRVEPECSAQICVLLSGSENKSSCSPRPLHWIKVDMLQPLQEPSPTLTAFIEVIAHDAAGPAAFMYACHVLRLAADYDSELPSILRRAKLPGLVGRRLLDATVGRRSISDIRPEWRGGPPALDAYGAEWAPFATAAVRLLEVLVRAEDACEIPPKDPMPGMSGKGLDNFVRRGPVPPTDTYVGKVHRLRALGHLDDYDEIVADACLEALRRSLLQDAGHLVIQPMHRSNFRTLAHLAHLAAAISERLIDRDLFVLVEQALTVASDEEAVVGIFECVAELFLTSRARARTRIGSLADKLEVVASRYPVSKPIQVAHSNIFAQPSIHSRRARAEVGHLRH